MPFAPSWILLVSVVSIHPRQSQKNKERKRKFMDHKQAGEGNTQVSPFKLQQSFKSSNDRQSNSSRDKPTISTIMSRQKGYKYVLILMHFELYVLFVQGKDTSGYPKENDDGIIPLP